MNAADAVNTDAGEVAADLACLGRILAGDMPGQTLRDRLNAAAFAVLVLLDGGTGTGPVALHPTKRPDIDLAGACLQDEWPAPGITVGVYGRVLLHRLARLVHVHSHGGDLPVVEVVRGFLAAVTCELAAGYTLHLVELDELGHPIVERDDIAGELPAAFEAAWNRRAAA